MASLHPKIPQIVQMLAPKQPRSFFSAGHRVLVEDMEFHDKRCFIAVWINMVLLFFCFNDVCEVFVCCDPTKFTTVELGSHITRLARFQSMQHVKSRSAGNQPAVQIELNLFGLRQICIRLST